MAPNQKVNLKDKIDDGEMDLSMCDLQDVPVKEIAAYKKVYSLDLSNNHLVALPKNFPTLTNITKLDLSKNKLKILPDNFGDLTKLKHLDLYKNELQHLPVSFCNLKGLKWLDLKDNPLVTAIKDAAGQCLDSKQCQVCATNMVNFYTQLKVKIDQEREVREKQRLRDKQANEAALKLKQQQEKKIKKKEKNKQSEPVVKPKELHIETKTDDNEKVEVKHKPEKSSKLFSFMISMVFLISITIFLLTSIKFKETEFIDVAIRKYWSVFLEKIPPSIQHYGNQTGIFVNDFHQQVGKFVFQLRENEKFMYIVFKFKEFYNSVIPTAK